MVGISIENIAKRKRKWIARSWVTDWCQPCRTARNVLWHWNERDWPMLFWNTDSTTHAFDIQLEMRPNSWNIFGKLFEQWILFNSCYQIELNTKRNCMHSEKNQTKPNQTQCQSTDSWVDCTNWFDLRA